jgi:hypothetical protein
VRKVRYSRIKFDCTHCDYSTGWGADDTRTNEKRWKLIVSHWNKEHPSERGFMTRIEYTRTQLVMVGMGMEEL